MNFTSHNPTLDQDIATYVTVTPAQIAEKIKLASSAFEKWSQSPLSQRSQYLLMIAAALRLERVKLATTAAQEMGKTLSSNLAEVEKCALVCEYYAQHGEQLLKTQSIETEASESFVEFQPLGVIFAIMPWNFPFWQVFRAAAPAVISGNTLILKHSSLVPACALAIEKIFTSSLLPDMPKEVFQSIFISSRDSELLISHPAVTAVTLTGSEQAGSSVASLAGKHLKKCVLELGGSDPFIVLDDADLEKASTAAVESRLIANGQSCIAAKRFIVDQKIAAQFCELFKAKLEKIRVGDPLETNTQLGPLASQQILETLEAQVAHSLTAGAVVVTGGARLDRRGFYFAPTLIRGVKPGMAIYEEETFGPVAAVIEVTNDQEALKVANDTKYGLGASIWTTDSSRTKIFIKKLQSGCVFINSMVKSDPRMPFGGVKLSGFGRELSEWGVKEFVNVKSVWSS